MLHKRRCCPPFATEDLWSHDDVSKYADVILSSLQAGTMPCDGAWPQAQVDLFRRWTESGKRS